MTLGWLMYAEPTTSTGMVEVAHGLRAQSPLRVVQRADDPTGLVSLETREQITFPYEFVATLEILRGRYEVTELGFRGNGAAIGTGWLAKAPIAEMRHYALNYANLEIGDPPGAIDEIYANRFIEGGIEALRRGTPSSDLQTLAVTYRVMRLGWRKPVAILAEKLEVHHDTVRRWIVAATKAGYLEEWERG